MGRDVIVAFDDIVHGTTSVYSSSFVELALGELESIALQVVAEPLTTPSDNVTIQIETSADGRNWVSKNPTAEIVMMSTPAGATTSGYGFDPGLFPAFALVRIRVQLGGGVGCRARIAVYAREGPNLGFLPSRLAGCALWLRADLGVTLVSGNASVWADQSGNANDATQSTAGRRPAYNDRPINGLPSLFFDPSTAGSEKYMTLTNSLAALTASHAFVVHSRRTATEATASATGFWSIGSSAFETHMPWTDGSIYDDGGGTFRYTCGTPVVTLTTSQVYEVRNQAGSWKSLANGTTQFSSATNTVGLTTTPQIGGTTPGDAGGAAFYRGDWAEMILYNRILTPAERALLIAYLNNRYALGAT